MYELKTQNGGNSASNSPFNYKADLESQDPIFASEPNIHISNGQITVSQTAILGVPVAWSMTETWKCWMYHESSSLPFIADTTSSAIKDVFFNRFDLTTVHTGFGLSQCYNQEEVAHLNGG